MTPRASCANRTSLSRPRWPCRAPPSSPCRRDRACAAPRRRPSTASIARTIGAAASACPRCSSISAPDQICPIGLAMPLPAMSGAEPCTGSNSRRKHALGIDVGRRRDADRAADRGPEVGKNVAEQVRADDDVETVRALHEVRGEDVDVILVGANARILRRHRAKALVPVRHRDRDAVGLGRRGDVLRRARLRQLEGELEDAIHALAREDGLLEHDLALGAFEHATADRRILAFGVLAHDDEIDVAGLAVGERRRRCRASAGTAAG